MDTPTSIDACIFLKAYAFLAASAGIVLIGWGPLWLGTDLPGLPWYLAALIRVTGSILVAAAGCAWQLSKIEDPVAAQRALLLFTIAHAAVTAVLMTQQHSVLSLPIAALALHSIEIVTLMLFMTWIESYAWKSQIISIFSSNTQEPTTTLRSHYEQEIREAAGQEERNRLARELHDSIKQQIFVIQTSAATVEARFDSDPLGAREALEQVRTAARSALTELETVLTQLRAEPIENSSLVTLIRQECEALELRTGAKVEFHAAPLSPNETLPPGAPRAILRVVQESCANIARHARASHVIVSLSRVRERLTLRTEDDGRGFDPACIRSGMGIGNMRARAREFGGDFDLDSSPGWGTSITFSIPCSRKSELRSLSRKAWFYGAASLVAVLTKVIAHQPPADIMALIFFVMMLRYATAYRNAKRFQPIV
jgi:signal transduction histidine kinase